MWLYINLKQLKYKYEWKKLYANRYLFREGRIGADIVIDHNFVEDAGPIKNKGFDINSLVFFFFGFTNIAIQKGPIQNVEIRKDIE